MTVPAFSLSVVLPGAPSPVAGAGGAAPTGGSGVFEGLLAGLLGAERGGGSANTGQDDLEDGDAGPVDTSRADATSGALDPGLAQMLAAFGMLPAAPPTGTTSAEAETPSETIPVAGDGDSRLLEARTPIRTAIAEVVRRQLTESSDADGAVLDGEGFLAPIAANDPSPTRNQFGVPPARTRPERAAAPHTAPSAVPTAPQSPVQAAPVAPLTPTQPVIAAATAAATVAEAEAVAETPAISALAPARTGSTDGEARRAASPTRGDRRDVAGRSGAVAASPGSASPFTANPNAVAANASPDAATGDTDTDTDLGPAPDLAAADLADAPETRQPAGLAETRAQAAQTAAPVAEAAPRGSPETVARLAADIVRKADGQSTRFDLQLDPHGMGKVDVSIEIDKDGRLTAAMSFDSAQSASDLRGRAGELRLALEQAGFDIAEGGLTFDMSGHNAGLGGREAGQQDRAWNGRAFQRAQTGAEDADLALAVTPSTPSRWTRSGVDIRI